MKSISIMCRNHKNLNNINFERINITKNKYKPSNILNYSLFHGEYFKKNFSFKLAGDKQIPEFNPRHFVKGVNERIDILIDKFKIHNSVYPDDMIFFIDNIFLYQFKTKTDEIKYVLLIINYIVSNLERRSDIKFRNIRNISSIHKQILQKNISFFNFKNLLSCYYQLLDSRIKSYKLRMNFLNTIGNFVENEFKTNKDIEYKIDFLLQNYDDFLKLELLLDKQSILSNSMSSLINEIHILLKDKKIHIFLFKDKILSINFQNLIVTCFMKIPTDEKSSRSINLFNEIYNSLNGKELNYHENILIDDFKEKDKLKFPIHLVKNMEYIINHQYKIHSNSNNNIFRLLNQYLIFFDKSIDSIMLNMTKNFNENLEIIEFYQRLAKILNFREKTCFTNLREFHKIISQLSLTIHHSLFIRENSYNSECLCDSTLEKSENKILEENVFDKLIYDDDSLIKFQIQFYPQIKSYIYQYDEEISKIFKIWHKNNHEFFKVLKDRDFKEVKNKEKKKRFFDSVINIIRLASVTYMDSDYIVEFLTKNNDEFLEVFRNNNQITYEYHYILSLIYYGKTFFNYKNILEETLLMFMENTFKYSYAEKEMFYSILCSIFYNLILMDFNNKDILLSLFNLIIDHSSKNHKNQNENLFRLNLIMQILKYQYKEIYESSKMRIKELELVLNKVMIEFSEKRKNKIESRIWWDKNYYIKNVYSKEYIMDYIKNNISEHVIIMPNVKNTHIVDFQIGENKYLEFLGPFHLKNNMNIKEFNSDDLNILTEKITKKKMWFKENNLELKSISYLDIIKDIDIIKRVCL